MTEKPVFTNTIENTIINNEINNNVSNPFETITEPTADMFIEPVDLRDIDKYF